MERQMTQNVRVQKIYVRFALIRNRKDQKITVDKITFVTKMSVVNIQMR